jgi:hypothetical protein
MDNWTRDVQRMKPNVSHEVMERRCDIKFCSNDNFKSTSFLKWHKSDKKVTFRIINVATPWHNYWLFYFLFLLKKKSQNHVNGLGGKIKKKISFLTAKQKVLFGKVWRRLEQKSQKMQLAR